MTYTEAKDLLKCFTDPEKVGLFNAFMPEILAGSLSLESIREVLIKQIDDTLNTTKK